MFHDQNLVVTFPDYVCFHDQNLVVTFSDYVCFHNQNLVVLFLILLSFKQTLIVVSATASDSVGHCMCEIIHDFSDVQQIHEQLLDISFLCAMMH